MVGSSAESEILPASTPVVFTKKDIKPVHDHSLKSKLIILTQNSCRF